MLGALTLLLALQLVGEALAAYFSLPLPGPVIGMALMLAFLFIRRGPTPAMTETARGLLERLSLLFVPAGVGVTLHLTLIEAEWRSIGAAVIFSTLIGIVVTAAVMTALQRRKGGEDG